MGHLYRNDKGQSGFLELEVVGPCSDWAMVWEPGVGNSCAESLPDGSCDLRLRDGGPAPTVQEGSDGKERKGDSDFPLVLPSDALPRSPPGSRGPGTPSHPSWSSSFQGREQEERGVGVG